MISTLKHFIVVATVVLIFSAFHFAHSADDRYIDPSQLTGGDGSLTSPYNSFTELNDISGDQAGTTWHIKRGTSIRSSILIQNATNFSIDAYGEGVLPTIDGSIDVAEQWIKSTSYENVWYFESSSPHRLYSNLHEIKENTIGVESLSVWEQYYDSSITPPRIYLKTDGSDPTDNAFELSNIRYVVHLAGCSNFSIQNIRITKADIHGLLLTPYNGDDLTNVLIEGIETSYCGGFNHTGQDGIDIHGTAGSLSTGIIVRNCKSHHNANNGIELHNLDGAVVESNELYENRFNAVENWETVKHEIIQNNVAYNNARLAWYADHMPPVPIASWSADGYVGFITTSLPHYLAPDDTVEISETSAIDGVYRVLATTDSYGFSIGFNLDDAHTGSGNTGWMRFKQDHDANIIRNNLAYDLRVGGVEFESGVGNHIYNNTFVLTNVPAFIAEGGSNYQFYNNICIQTSDDSLRPIVKMDSGTGAETQINKNIYFHTKRSTESHQPIMRWEGIQYATESFLNWRTYSGQDADSLSGSDPQLVDVDGKDFRLTETSVARFETTPGFLLTDIDVFGRPRIGGVDIGAIQYPRDFDNDGLLDSFEVSIGTDPENVDTDLDGLTDFEEISWDGDSSAYNVLTDLNPLSKDSDGDGFSDGMEVTTSHNPIDGTDSPVWGDINDDGIINAVDILKATRAILNLVTLSDKEFALGNVAPLVHSVPEPDDVFNLGDLLVIQELALGLISAAQ